MSNLPAHSKLGASQMYRIIPCPGSVNLSDGLESVSSVYAAEGTVAHTVASECLQHRRSPSDYTERPFKQEAGHIIRVTEEMVDAVLVYLTTVRGDFAEAPHRPELFVEHKFHLKDIHDDLYGTADCVALYREQKLLRVYDYKHGAGVAVEVKDNPQLKYYALGALLTCNAPVTDVEIVIVQPRCPHPDGPVRRHLIKAVDLLEFSADLLDAVHATEAPDAPLNDGDWCRWCPAAGICPQLARRAQTVAKKEFGTQLSYNPKELAETLDALPRIEAWVDAVRQFAYGEALHGRCPPGYKLVEKRATRKWLSEYDAEIKLLETGLSESDIYAPKKILSPAQVEKKLGKKEKNLHRSRDVGELLDPLVQAVSSGTTLVHASDNRAPVKSDAKSDFANAQEWP